MPIRCLSLFPLRRVLDSSAVAVSFTVAVSLAKAHNGFFSAPLLPELRELPLLFLLGIGWHLSARATGLYDPAHSSTIAGELTVLGKNMLFQFIGLAVVLFFMKSLTLNRFFALLYTAILCGSTMAARLIGRACGRARRLSPKFLLPAAGAIILACAALLFMLIPGRPPRPNIILFSIDTLRADRLGCYGCPTGTSPDIDAFSRDSVQFMQAISQAPSTATSHMSLFTGLLPPVHRVSSWLRSPDKAKRLNLSSLGMGIPTLAQYLKENGYRTVGLHNGGLVSPFFGFGRGFDLYTAKKIPWQGLFSNPSSLQIIKKLLRSSHDAREPLFLFLHTYICHDPYIKAPQKIRERFLPDPEPGLPIQWAGSKESFRDMHDSFWKAIDGNNQAHRRHVRALYDAQVNYADWIFGEIVALLKRNGSYDKTLIVLVSDHGEEFWEHEGTLHKDLFIETLHVPLLIKFPGGKYGGMKISTPVGQFDLMPTLLDHLRITPRLKLQARSLLPRIRGKETASGRVLSFDDGLQFVRIQQGQFVYSNGIKFKPGHWLFDNIKDPQEQNNLASANSQIVLQMGALAAKIMENQRMVHARIGARSSIPNTFPEDLKKQFKTLGYL